MTTIVITGNKKDRQMTMACLLTKEISGFIAHNGKVIPDFTHFSGNRDLLIKLADVFNSNLKESLILTKSTCGSHLENIIHKIALTIDRHTLYIKAIEECKDEIGLDDKYDFDSLSSYELSYLKMLRSLVTFDCKHIKKTLKKFEEMSHTGVEYIMSVDTTNLMTKHINLESRFHNESKGEGSVIEICNMIRVRLNGIKDIIKIIKYCKEKFPNITKPYCKILYEIAMKDLED